MLHLPEPLRRLLCLCVLQAHLRFGLSTSGVGVAAVMYFFAAATWSLADTSPSSQRLPGCWQILFLLRSGYLVADGYGRLLVRSGYLVAGGHCRLLLRSGYLVALWMDVVLSAAATWSLAVDAMLSTGGFFATTASPTLCWRPLRGCIFLGRHSQLVC